MFFTILVLAAALALESLGSYISVVGLSSKASFIIVILAITLDFSKVMIATVLYKKWKDIHLFTKAFLVPALIFLMIVTSSGTYAFLLQEFSKTTAGQEQLTAKIDLLNAEKIKLESRKKVIDDQVSQLPGSSVLQRKRLTDLFSKESTYINNRVIELDKEIPAATMKVMEDSTHSGTLGSIAKAYGVGVEQISKIIAFLIVLVVDPLAIVLLTVANFLMEQRKKEIREKLIAKLNGEIPLDEQGLFEKIKNKAYFLRSQFTQEELSASKILLESKNEIVKKAIMVSDIHKIELIDFVLSTNLIDNPKIFVPVKYSSNFHKILPISYLKKSNPVILTVPAEYSMVTLPNFPFIKKQQIIEPITITQSLIKTHSDVVSHNDFAISKSNLEPIYLKAEYNFSHVELYAICNKVNLVNPDLIQLSLEKNEPESIASQSRVHAINKEQLINPVQATTEKLANHEFITSSKIKILQLLEQDGLAMLPNLEFIQPKSLEDKNNLINLFQEDNELVMLDKSIISPINFIKTITLNNNESLKTGTDDVSITPTPYKPKLKNILKNNVKGGFFEEDQNKHFIPSNFEDNSFYETEDLWNNDNECFNSIGGLEDLWQELQEQLNEPTGFQTTGILLQNIQF
jgi:hypothetical protein